MRDDQQGSDRSPSVLRTTGAMLEWLLAAVLLGIAMLNMQPAVAMMVGSVIFATVVMIILLRRRNRSRMPALPLGAASYSHRRYWPEHPRQ